MPEIKLKQQDWSDFDKLMEDFGNDFKNEMPERKIKVEIKSRILGNEANELGWTAHDAFKFIAKVMPQLRSRLNKRVTRETDIQALYRILNKKEASKLINILKSIRNRNVKANP
jgi:hypothetical protein